MNLYSDIVSLKKLFKIAQSGDQKIFELVNKFSPKLDRIEYNLNIQAKLSKYLLRIKEKKFAYRELYTRILFMLQQYRQFVYLLHMVYELIFLRKNIGRNENFQRYLSILDEYIDLLAEKMKVFADLLLIVAPQSEYASLPMLSERIFIVMLPLTNLIKPWKWVLLSHELGHLFFQYRKENILTKARPLIEEELRETIRDEERVQEYVRLWDDFWLQEIVSDIVATSLCGPAYLKMFIIEATESKPTQLYGTHPPLDARAIAQITYMKLVGAPDELILAMERVWKAFRGGINETLSLPDYLSEDMVKHVSYLMVDTIKEPFIVTNWSDFRRTIEGLPETKNEDLRLVIPAIAMSDVYVKL